MKKLIIFLLIGYMLLTSVSSPEYLEPCSRSSSLIKFFEEKVSNQYQKYKNNFKVIGIKLTEYLG
jgi:hypothetical protein